MKRKMRQRIVELPYIRFYNWQVVLHNCENDLSVMDVYRKTKVTYSHLVYIFHQFRILNWVSLERVGRENIIKITPAGENIKKCSLVLVNEVKKSISDVKKSGKDYTNVIEDGGREKSYMAGDEKR